MSGPCMVPIGPGRWLCLSPQEGRRWEEPLRDDTAHGFRGLCWRSQVRRQHLHMFCLPIVDQTLLRFEVPLMRAGWKQAEEP